VLDFPLTRVKVGTVGKNLFRYVLAVRTILNQYPTAEILARGHFISLAVDIALICKREFPAIVEDIRTYTEKLNNKNGKLISVSAIRIRMKMG
jgi:DNA-binding protein Alba